MSEAKFVGGLIAKAPHEKAPEYVKARLSIKREELIAWLQTERGEWINADVKVSQNGRWYVAVDDWKPDANRSGQRNERPQQAQRQSAPVDDFKDDEIPW